MDNSQLNTIAAIGSTLTLVTQVIAILNTNYKEARNRRWAIEDQATIAAKLAQENAEIARISRHGIKETDQHIGFKFDEHKKILEDIAKAAEKRLELIIGEVKKGAAVSEKALEKANNVNDKLKELGVEIRDTTIKPVEIVNKNPIEVEVKP